MKPEKMLKATLQDLDRLRNRSTVCLDDSEQLCYVVRADDWLEMVKKWHSESIAPRETISESVLHSQTCLMIKELEKFSK